MEKKVTFEKEIQFPTMIGEISAISLEPRLNFIDDLNIEGNLILQGKYKLTEASRLEEDFQYEIPIEIALNNKIYLDGAKAEISDFTYDIVNEDVMNCHIEMMIRGEEIVEERECDDNPLDKEIEIPAIEPKDNIEDRDEEIISEEKEEIIEKEKEEKNETSMFLNFSEEDETYGTFLVYIVRQNESINSIIEKYHTTLEDVEQYNDISNIKIGSKLIIPLKNE